MLKIESMNEMVGWTTWEELLLTCAVKRYGLQNWNAIAMELQSRVSVPVLVNAQICRKKYNDLKRRFAHNTSVDNDVAPAGGDGVDSSVPWLEELRKRRIDELRRKVHGHDLSIQNLETKAKRLEEEKQQSNEIDDKKPDLEKDSEDRSENDKNNATGKPPVDNDAGVSVSGERSERENQSVNESNSTDNRHAGEMVSKPIQNSSISPDPDSDTKPVRADSWNDSSKPSGEKKINDKPAELHDSAAGESKGETKESSDMQSSASLTRKSGEDEPVVSPATMRRDQVKKTEPLVQFLDMVSSHKHGSMFEKRLESQKSDEYKSLVKQHVDLETVQTGIENGSYSTCTAKFYLDLLLLVNNAIIFFPKASPESAAAFELRNLILKDMNKNCIGRQPNSTLKPDPSPFNLKPDPSPLNPKPDPERPDSLLAKQKSSTPLMVCRKRSSISSKPSSSNRAVEKPVINPKAAVKPSSSSEEESVIKLKLKEKPVTGAWSMRRSGNGRTNTTITSTNKGEAPKTEKAKNEVLNTAKRRGAADFLKRIKKNSPAKGIPLLETLKSSPENSSESCRREPRYRQKKRVDERKEVVARQKGGGGSDGAEWKLVKEENSPSKRGVGRPAKPGNEATPVKRGREGEEAGVAAKKPKKRTRR